MNTKTVYQTDDNGFYIGETIAFESPLEPGVYHIPRGCVEEQPPKVSFKERPRLVNNVWIKEIIYTEEEIKQIEEQMRLEAEKEQKRLEEQKKAEEERLRLEQEQERLRLEEKQRRAEEKQRKAEEEQKRLQEQEQFKKANELNRLKEILKVNEKLNNLSYGQYMDIQSQIKQLEQ
jgi:hypothetical protein